MKKVISVFLAVLILMTIFPLSVFAENTSDVIDSGYCGIDGDNITWTLYKDGNLIIKGDGLMKSYGYSSDAPWYGYRSSISKLIIETGVTSIGNYAFRGTIDCWYQFTDVDIPEGVTYIGEYAFYFCKQLEKVSLPNTLKTIGRQAFCLCTSLSEINIPEGVTSIETGVFQSCYCLLNITIPSTVTRMGKSVCGNFSRVEKIIFADGFQTIDAASFEGCSTINCVVIPDSVAVVEDNAFNGCSAIKTVYYRGTEEQWNNITIGTGNGYLKSAENIVFNTICHEYEANVVAPTCIAKGYTEYACKICDDKYIDTDSYIDLAAHQTISGQCSVCKMFIVEEHEEISLSVDLSTDSEVTWSLSNENAEIISTGLSKVSWGSYVNVVASAKIKGISVGTATLTAVVNGDVVSTAEIEIIKHEHLYESAVTFPTCTEKGYTTHTCTCGDSYVDNYIDSTGHIEEIIPGIPATCTLVGLTEGSKCSVCGEILVYQEAIPELMHILDDWEVVNHAQVGVDGLEQQKCTVCGIVIYIRAIPALPEQTTKPDVTYTTGDVNGDGKITAADARIVLRVSAKLESIEQYNLPLAAFDATGDGKLTAADARKVLRISAKLEK